jgi:hypothetical protein
MTCFRLAVMVCGQLALSSLAVAQTPAQAPPTTPAPAPVPAVYVPTSLQAEPGLPRTPDGHPDFQGVVWYTDFWPLMQSRPAAPALIISEEQAKALFETETAPLLNRPFADDTTRRIVGASRGLPIVRGQRRSRLVVLPADGKLPYTPEAREELAADDPEKFDNPEERPLMERCIALAGAPPISSPLLAYQRFVQTPDYVVINTEEGDEARIIPFATAHRARELKPPLGDSIARWEGDTLVIETIGPPAGARVRIVPRFIVSAESTVIERYTRLSKDELLYQYTVIDPKVYAAPWLAEHSLYRSDEVMYPSACHEANYSLPGILRGGQRVANARAAKPKL